jgi:L-amino acid N-acyltransferase YncA
MKNDINEISFKKIKYEHFKTVTEIYNYYIRNSTATYHIATLDEKGVAEHFELKSVNTKSYVITNNKEIIGFCLIRPYSKKEGYKYTYEITIYLKSDYRKKGIGAKALLFLEDMARKSKIHMLIAGICDENAESIKLFEKHGYSRCGDFKEVGYKFNRYLDTIYYQKRIDSAL